MSIFAQSLSRGSFDHDSRLRGFAGRIVLSAKYMDALLNWDSSPLAALPRRNAPPSACASKTASLRSSARSNLLSNARRGVDGLPARNGVFACPPTLKHSEQLDLCNSMNLLSPSKLSSPIFSTRARSGLRPVCGRRQRHRHCRPNITKRVFVLFQRLHDNSPIPCPAIAWPSSAKAPNAMCGKGLVRIRMMPHASRFWWTSPWQHPMHNGTWNPAGWDSLDPLPSFLLL